MPKKPESADQMWALAYSVAASLLTLGYAIRGKCTDSLSQLDQLDERAAWIANNALQRLRERKVL